MANTDTIRTKRTNISFIRMDNLMATPQEQNMFLPEHTAEVAKVHDFLEAHAAAGRSKPEPQYFLAGASANDRVELPAEMFQLLRNVVVAMNRGEAVSIAPYSLRLSTQQAAEFLNISRPTFVRFLEQGKIPFEKINKHRKVLLSDVIAFQESRIAAIQESLVTIQGQYEDLVASADDLKAARSAIAARRALKNA